MLDPNDVVALPKTAHGPAIPQPAGYYCAEIRDGVYWITEGIYQSMFLTTGEGVIVVDACPTIGGNLLAAIGEVTGEPITHVIYSHSHTDHVGAGDLLPEDAIRIAHDDAATLLARAGDPHRPGPTVTFADSYVLEVGNKTLVLEYKGPDHDPGNIFIHAPDQRVLMKVDVFYPGWVPFKHLAFSEDLRGFMDVHDVALSYEFDSLVSGHIGRLGTPDDIQIQKEYLGDLRDAATKELESADMPALVAASGYADPSCPAAGNHWYLFENYFDVIAKNVTNTVLPKWKDRLGGADVFTYGHALVLAEALRLDWGVGVYY